MKYVEEYNICASSYIFFLKIVLVTFVLCLQWIGLNRKSSPGIITHAREFQTLYFLVGVTSEDRIEILAKNIEFLILKEI